MLLFPPESYDTFLASSFSNHVFATISSLATANSSTISPSTFLTPYPFPPWTSSYPSASSPTCPFKSPHTITTSCSPNPSTTPPSSTYNPSFSSINLPICEPYTDTTHNITLPTVTFTTITLSLTLSTPITLSTHFLATIIPTPPPPSSHPLHQNLNSPIHSQQFPSLPFLLVSCTHPKSKHLLSIISTTSPSLPLIVPTFTVPILNLSPSPPIVPPRL